MLKKHLKSYFFKWEAGSRKWEVKILFFTFYFSLLTFYLSAGCAPKVFAPPSLYKDKELSLKEIITLAQRDIHSVKAVATIIIEKNDSPYSHVDAALLLKKPNWLHMRLYKFGLPAGNFLMKGGRVYAISGKGSSKFRDFGRELFYSVFWWEDVEHALMYRDAENYVIRTQNKEISLNRNTLLPEKQVVTVNNKKIYMEYSEPRVAIDGTQSRDEVWYPSQVRIEVNAYRVTIKIEKLLINPVLNEDDFREPPDESHS